MSQSPGFTLVELLVVITIIGILVALLLPAVESVREAGRLVTCKNNLHQIGVACTGHLEKYGYFPSGGWGMCWAGDPDRGSGGRQPGGWIYQILPFMGQDTIHDLGAGQGRPTSGSPKYVAQGQARGTPVSTFICPTRRKVMAFPDAISQGAINAGNSGTLSHNDYCANAGTDWVTNWTTPGDLSCYDNYPNCGFPTEQLQIDGIVSQNSQVSPAQISDGMSYTFLAGEKYLMPKYYYNSLDHGDDNSMLNGHDHDQLRWCASDPPQHAGWTPASVLKPLRDTPGVIGDAGGSGEGDNAGGDTPFNFGSAHVAGLNFVYCDGSVQLINFNVDPKTYACLGCRNDRLKLPQY
jgi:prepilin-type N-terminal cleavage/methylation domain-containing protein